MKVAIYLPDAIAHRLREKWGQNIPRHGVALAQIAE